VSAAILFILNGCSNKKFTLPPYEEFTAAQQKAVPPSIVEIYGRYLATLGSRKGRSRFNLLLNPGKTAYLEVVDAGNQLVYSVSLDREEISMLWAKEKQYLREKATPENLNSIIGLYVLPDDLLNLVAGNGLNFDEWQKQQDRKNGWDLTRAGFHSEINMTGHLSKIAITSDNGSKLITKYDDYKIVDTRTFPVRLRFEVPQRELVLELRWDRHSLRDERADGNLFAINVPKDVQRVSIKDLYRGKPILFE
jgi:hypothetical protein